MKAPVIPPTLAQIAPPPKKERKRKSKEEGTVPAAVDGEKKVSPPLSLSDFYGQVSDDCQ